MNMRRLKMPFLALLLPLTVTGCAGGLAVTDFLPIRPTQSDMVCMSDKLVNQIYIHDLTGQKLYGWKP
jgi:hypothetical protein